MSLKFRPDAETKIPFQIVSADPGQMDFADKFASIPFPYREIVRSTLPSMPECPSNEIFGIFDLKRIRVYVRDFRYIRPIIDFAKIVRILNGQRPYFKAIRFENNR